MKHFLVLLILFTFLISCTTLQKKETEYDKKQDRIENIIDSLSVKYNAIKDFEDYISKNNIKYIFELEEEIKKIQRPVIIRGEILDIEKYLNDYFIIAKKNIFSFNLNYIFNDIEFFYKLKTDRKFIPYIKKSKQEIFSYFLFIVKLSNIKKVEIMKRISDEDEIIFNPFNDYMIYGDCIDLIFIE